MTHGQHVRKQETFLSAATHISCDDGRYRAWRPLIVTILSIWLLLPLGVAAVLAWLKRTDRLDKLYIFFAVFLDTYQDDYWYEVVYCRA